VVCRRQSDGVAPGGLRRRVKCHYRIMELTVVDNPEAGRFEARTPDGHVAGFVGYRHDGELLALEHTEVDKAYAGQGVGSVLVGGMLDLLLERGEAAVNECPFIARFMSRTPGKYDWVG